MEKNVINSVLPLFVKVLTLGLKNRLGRGKMRDDMSHYAQGCIDEVSVALFILEKKKDVKHPVAGNIPMPIDFHYTLFQGVHLFRR